MPNAAMTQCDGALRQCPMAITNHESQITN
jgi:hypothetical protein